MRVRHFFWIVCVCLCWASSARSAELDGLWLGYEPIPNISPDEKGARWFYENRLSVSNGVVRLEKLPVWRKGKKKDLIYSASDGAFPTFQGRLEIRGGATVATLEIQSCDYCGEVRDGAAEGHKAWHVLKHGVMRQGEPKDYPIEISDRTLKLDGIMFRRVTKFP
jgi:hypothetical protein